MTQAKMYDYFKKERKQNPRCPFCRTSLEKESDTMFRCPKCNYARLVIKK